MSRLLVLSHPLHPDASVWAGDPPGAAVEGAAGSPVTFVVELPD